ncbi:uncharacterized protein TNCT_58661 [Trichonephila clavata]|uniref:Uncharacterized protein n=1 Tax=Trichonephila clavata TaxID=2740835 RepID=A0A8X6IBK6_TRICU|nr:uncharacterized protein TNCT_256851 [Trichonephila clavata]GFQ76126.1 uncharacterized protein TNCT_244091 [Trichonephila clavata]GFQ80166.1 uncharacterized protein TNCT_55941 [Trichonephila clavata]GFR09754.1 uncharacterized protein TNCT_668781 [Trichonephila clavata]GFR13892.1 uncharacterized protein TNCT_226231 [Trichonephila clavata]
MFDLQRIKTVVAERYFRLLRGYNQTDLLQRFMQRWMDLLSMYSSQTKFISFDPPTPILESLIPMAVGVLVVPFPNTTIPPGLKRITIFPLYPFRIQYTSHTECSRDGMEMLCLYLKLTGIKIIGFFNVPLSTQHHKLIPELQQSFPHLRIYGSSAFNNFRTVCHRKATTILSGGSKFQ